jgi:hypothetical protein
MEPRDNQTYPDLIPSIDFLRVLGRHGDERNHDWNEGRTPDDLECEDRLGHPTAFGFVTSQAFPTAT